MGHSQNTLFAGLMANANPNKLFATIPSFKENIPTRYYSYRDVEDVSGRFANRLIELGVEPGDRVAVQVPKSIEALMLYLGTVRAGGVFLPLNPAYTKSEIEYFLEDAIPRVFVCDPKDQDSYAPLAQREGFALETMGIWETPEKDAGSFLDASIETSIEFDDVARDPDDLAAILYTSGTTGALQGGNVNSLKPAFQLTGVR